MKTKLVRPVLVETKKHTNLWSYKGRRLYYDQANFNDEDETVYYQLILISLDPDEKIEDSGLWYMNDECSRDNGIVLFKILTVGKSLLCENINGGCFDTHKNWISKVIARQSQISPEYISKFVEQYNGICIEDLEIVMESYWENYHGSETTIEKDYCYNKIRPKLTNGFVSIVE